ncbi:hypothetical protein [Streptomyces uncialis]|uniref:hypothetical protein n=1 Tax=Streptomyces uncialis TaxID=1048205 RepID=UPI0038679BB8|nr:hypothetical protein OG924_29970 [Streptomyces uncialis]
MPAAGPISAKIPSSPYVRYRVEGREPRHDPTAPALSSREIVAFHLARLGLGVTEVHGSTGLRQVVPDGSGVCRAHTLGEEAWPRGAELCALVSWTPDSRYQHNSWDRHQPVTVPDGADEHWRERITMTIAALESLGFVAQETGPPRRPGYHPGAELLVYRMPPGMPAPRQPADAFAGWPPQTPNLQVAYRYPAPAERISALLDDAGFRPQQPITPTGHGRCVTRSITMTVWPPGSAACALVIWEPDPLFRPTADGQLPDRTAEHWETGTARIEELLASHGYILTRRERPVSPTTDHQVAYLAHLPAQQSVAVSPAGGPR